MMLQAITRQALMFVAIVALICLPGCSSRSDSNSTVLKIGYQKWGTYSILKASGELSKAFESRGIQIEWIEFPAGPPLLEALNAGSIDLGHTGDSPPLFAQAAGVPFVYFAVSSPSPTSSAILVRESSNIRAAEDLRGKKIGFAKGTSGHTMVLRYLEKNNLSLSDVTPVYLSPADGRVAFETGSIDAWSVWDPYFAAAEKTGQARILANGKGYVEGREFYLASKRIVDDNPQLLKDFLTQLTSVKSWAATRPDEVNQFLARETGLPVEAIALAESRRLRYETNPLDAKIIASQQELADRYFGLGLLPQKINVQDAVHGTISPENR